MSSEALQAAKAYRQLLKAVKKHIAQEDSKRRFKEYVTEEFRKKCTPSDLSAVRHKIKLANDYTFLLNSVHHHQALPNFHPFNAIWLFPLFHFEKVGIRILIWYSVGFELNNFLFEHVVNAL